MVDFNTLGELLVRQYVQSFDAEMQKLGAMEKTLMWINVAKDTNFGKLLHKEDLWSLYQYKEEKSLLYHLCRNEYGRMELQNNPCDPESSQCMVCQAEAPDEIRGLWTLHNFDWIQQNGGRNV